MLTVHTLYDIAARVAGIGVLVTGAELVAAVPAVVRWSRPGPPRSTAWVTGHRILAALLAVLGAAFVVEPGSCLRGGGLVAAAGLAYFALVFRPLGDGADVMLFLVLVGIGALEVMPTTGMAEWAAWCLAGNVCLAYWWSGVAKLRVPAWRGGRQVALAVNSRRFGAPAVAWRLLHHTGLSRMLSWGAIALEVACPVFLLIGGWPLVWWAVCVVAMHVAIAVLMGLGRFLWAFGAGVAGMIATRSLI